MTLSNRIEQAAEGSRELDWLPMESYLASKGPAILCLGETIPDLADARVGSFCSAEEVKELGHDDLPFGGWMIWNDCSDWYFIEPSAPLGWLPLPANIPARPAIIEQRAPYALKARGL